MNVLVKPNEQNDTRINSAIMRKGGYEGTKTYIQITGGRGPVECARTVALVAEKLQEEYPTLSKGIYQKSGQGVNGVYNQDFHKHTILIEIGGYENTTSEVLNSTLAFSKVFMEVLHDE